jgi:distribution and morphology protein 31
LTAPEEESTSRRVRIYDDGSEIEIEEAPKVVIDIDLRFRDVKAAVPMFTSDLSYVNNALIRPIVAFVKSVVLFSCAIVY